MSPEEIRNTLDDDADRAPSDLTVWRDRGLIIAAQQTRIAQLEAQVAAVRTALSAERAWSDEVGPCVGIAELRDALNFPRGAE